MERIYLHPAHLAEAAPDLSVGHWFNTERSIDLWDLRGQVVVLHAFQMLCPDSVLHGLPQAGRIRESFDERDVAVIGLHRSFEVQESMGPLTLAAFLAEYGVDTPVAVDAPADEDSVSTMEAYGLAGTPSLVLIDRFGRMRAHVYGRPSDMLVGSAIASLVAEKQPRPVLRGRRPRLVTPMDTAFSDGHPHRHSDATSSWPLR